MALKLFVNSAEAQSGIWQKLKAHYESELDKLRKQNDGDLDEKQTANLRGRITEIKKLLALDTLPPGMKDGDSKEPPSEY